MNVKRFLGLGGIIAFVVYMLFIRDLFVYFIASVDAVVVFMAFVFMVFIIPISVLIAGLMMLLS